MLTFYTNIAFGQEKVRYLTIDEGLSNNTVTCISKDKQGFMWFGTYDGLNRYDGYIFKKYNHKIGDPTSMDGNMVSTIAEDNEGRHWIGTGPGISVLDDKTSSFLPVKFFPFNFKPEESSARLLQGAVNCIDKDGNGNMLAGSRQFGLIVFENEKLTGRQTGLKYHGKTIYNYSVTAILTSIQKKTWVCVENIGICVYDYKSGVLLVKHEENLKINCLIEGQKETLFVGTDKALYQFSTNSSELDQYKLQNGVPFYPGRIMSLCLESSDRLWIATDGNGISIVDIKDHQLLSLSHIIGNQTISSNAIYCLYKDDQERIWIGTFRGGINMIDHGGNPFYTVKLENDKKNSQPNNFIFSFYEDRKGEVWIGTDGAGISVWNRKINAFKNYVYGTGNSGLPGNGISSIIGNDAGEIFIAIYGEGIVKFNRRTEKFQRVAVEGAGTCKYAWRLYKDNLGEIWAGSCDEEKGLYKYDRGMGKLVQLNIVTDNVLALSGDHYGHIWIGGDGKLRCIDRKGEIVSAYNTYSSVRSIIEGKNGVMWIGTQGNGLIKCLGGKCQFFTEQQGLPNNNVLNILQDEQGSIWMSTFNGLSKFTPSKASFENFFDVDGLQSNQFYYNAAIRLNTGELMFGGIKGFTLFKPELCVPKKSFPPLSVTGIRILNDEATSLGRYIKGRSLYSPDEIEVPYNKAVLSIDFAALEYSLPRKIQYAYFLDGWDKTWIMAGNLKTANYSELREGNYVLRIKSTNVSGIWNRNELRLHIHILPPWYRTWWSRLAAILLVLGIIGTLLYYWEKQRRIKYKMKIAELKHNHEMELNEKRLSFFTNISHEFRSPLTLIINPIREILKNETRSPDHFNLSVLYSNAQRLLRMTDQLLLFRKADNELGKIEIKELDLLNLCRQIYFCFTEEAKSKNLKYEFDCILDEVRINADAQKVEIILFNLISNAIKFSRAEGSVMVKLEEIGNDYSVSIKDNGPGIPAGTGEKLFKKFYQDKIQVGSAEKGFGIGLYLSKAFADMHDAKLYYQCPESGGTIFTFSIKRASGQDTLKPLKKIDAHMVTEEIAASGLSVQSFLNTSANAETDGFGIQDDQLNDLFTNKKVMLVIDDDKQLRAFIKHLFGDLVVYEAENVSEGWKKVQQLIPDIVICDVIMEESNGIEFCKKLKTHSSFGHIPLILLTGLSSGEFRLKGAEYGADDYILKPFDSELLVARVNNILKDREVLKKFFFNEITLKPDVLKVSDEYRGFLTDCITVVEENIERDDFDSKVFAKKMGMSRSKLYVKVKAISGLSVNEFVKLIRLRKAAELMIHTDCQIKEICFQVGLTDPKYFREQFTRLFRLKPSEYIKKYRKTFQSNTHLNNQFNQIKDK